MFIELASDPGNFDLTRQYLYICRARSMEPPKEIEKEKNVNSTSVFSYRKTHKEISQTSEHWRGC